MHLLVHAFYDTFVDSANKVISLYPFTELCRFTVIHSLSIKQLLLRRFSAGIWLNVMLLRVSNELLDVLKTVKMWQLLVHIEVIIKIHLHVLRRSVMISIYQPMSLFRYVDVFPRVLALVPLFEEVEAWFGIH